MGKLKNWTIFFVAFGLVLFGCAVPSTLNSSKSTLTQENMPTSALAYTASLDHFTQSPSSVPPTLTPSTVPPTSTPTLVPATQTPTIVPVAPADLVFSDLSYLPIKSLIGSKTPYGKVLGWLKNPMALPVKDIKLSYYYTKDGTKVPLADSSARFIGAGERVFVWASISVAVPEGAELGAEAVKLTAADPGLSAVTLEQRGLSTMAFPKDLSSFITGELYNPTDQPVTIWGATALWYNSANKVVHVATVFMMGHSVAPHQATAFRIDAAFKIMPPDAGVPVSELKRYELIVNTAPVKTIYEPITFQFASTPTWVNASQTLIAFAEATNTTDQWQVVNAFWVGYNQDGQVIGMFSTSMLGSVLAPGETRPMQFILSLPGGLKPDKDWAGLVTQSVMIDNYSQSTEPLLTLTVSETKVEKKGLGFVTFLDVHNDNTVEISETSIVIIITDRATGKLVMVKEGRIAKGDNSNVVYAVPLAAGQSWPVESYFELPPGVTLDMVAITYSARGK